jgi:hypothetical protein
MRHVDRQTDMIRCILSRALECAFRGAWPTDGGSEPAAANSPSTGFATLLALLACSRRAVHVYGFNWSGHTWEGHDATREQALVASLEQRGLVTVHPTPCKGARCASQLHITACAVQQQKMLENTVLLMGHREMKGVGGSHPIAPWHLRPACRAEREALRGPTEGPRPWPLLRQSATARRKRSSLLWRSLEGRGSHPSKAPLAAAAGNIPAQRSIQPLSGSSCAARCVRRLPELQRRRGRRARLPRRSAQLPAIPDALPA